MEGLRFDWTLEDLKKIYHQPLMDLVYRAAGVHRKNFHSNQIQVSSLVSIKTGGCTEDCSYCPQAARYHTDVEVHKLLSVDEVLNRGAIAKENGVSRMCLGAAWREVRDNRDFDRVLEMVKGLNQMDMEVCCTLGMLTDAQAKRLEEAGLYAYNHNIDTSEDYYETIIGTREFEDRLKTLKSVRKTNITVCSGGIIGMGESIEDRLKMLITLSNLNPHPESVPINALVPVEGTPLQDNSIVPWHELVRMIALTRIIMPQSVVRLSAGRNQLNQQSQGWCFMAGANSIFSGEKLLTTPNPEKDEDAELFDVFGLKPKSSFQEMSINKEAMLAQN